MVAGSATARLDGDAEQQPHAVGGVCESTRRRYDGLDTVEYPECAETGVFIARGGVVERLIQASPTSGLDIAGRRVKTFPRHRGGLRALWWASVPVWSLGMLSAVPFFRRAIGSRRPRDWGVTFGYVFASVVEIVLLGVAGDPAKASGSAVGLGDIAGGLALLLMSVGGVHAWVAFRAPWEIVSARFSSPGEANRAVVAAATEAGKRRVEGRRIAETNPILARDLRIGRPDLPRAFDDGGLIDVNHVSAAVMTQALGWSFEEAGKVVEARERSGGFQSVADLTVYVEIDPRRVDSVADLLVCCRF